jgi:hypothetical protein
MMWNGGIEKGVLAFFRAQIMNLGIAEAYVILMNVVFTVALYDTAQSAFPLISSVFPHTNTNFTRDTKCYKEMKNFGPVPFLLLCLCSTLWN